LREKLIDVARKAIEEDGAEVVILGGGPLIGYGKEIEKDLGIPVIDPTLAALKLMEGFIDQGYCQSKICRWSPPLDTLGDASGSIPYNRKWLELP
jgi:allantoin racemase